MVRAAIAEVRIGGEVFRVSETVLVRCEDRVESSVVRIAALWEDHGVQYFAGHVYYRPEETRLGRLRDHEFHELFMTTNKIEGTVDAIDAHCTVKTWDEYQVWLDEPIGNDIGHSEEYECTFMCRASYDPFVDEFHPLGRARTRAWSSAFPPDYGASRFDGWNL